MCVRTSALACCGILLGLGLGAADARADAVKATPELTVFSGERTSSPDIATVLRGDAIRRGVVDGRFGEGYQPGGLQIGAGAKLWMTDPASGRVIVCDERRSSRVGSRFIGCVEDTLTFKIEDY